MPLAPYQPVMSVTEGPHGKPLTGELSEIQVVEPACKVDQIQEVKQHLKDPDTTWQDTLSKWTGNLVLVAKSLGPAVEVIRSLTRG